MAAAFLLLHGTSRENTIPVAAEAVHCWPSHGAAAGSCSISPGSAPQGLPLLPLNGSPGSACTKLRCSLLLVILAEEVFLKAQNRVPLFTEQLTEAVLHRVRTCSSSNSGMVPQGENAFDGAKKKNI